MYLGNIQWQCSQVLFPFLFNERVTCRGHSTKHDKPTSFKIKRKTPRQRIRRHTCDNCSHELPIRISESLTNSFLPRPIGEASSTSLPPHLPRITPDDDPRDNGPASDEDDGHEDLVPTDPALQALDRRRVLRRG